MTIMALGVAWQNIMSTRPESNGGRVFDVAVVPKLALTIAKLHDRYFKRLLEDRLPPLGKDIYRSLQSTS